MSPPIGPLYPLVIDQDTHTFAVIWIKEAIPDQIHISVVMPVPEDGTTQTATIIKIPLSRS